jgi:hypothetical protein
MAVGFKLIADPDTTEYRVFKISSTAFTIGDAVDISRTAGGPLAAATSSSTCYTIRGVAMETVTTAATTLLVALATSRQRWSVDANATTNVTHNGQRMALTDKSTVANTGTDISTVYGVFEQTGTVSTTRVVGRLLIASNVTA